VVQAVLKGVGGGVCGVGERGAQVRPRHGGVNGGGGGAGGLEGVVGRGEPGAVGFGREQVRGLRESSGVPRECGRGADERRCGGSSVDVRCRVRAGKGGESGTFRRCGDYAGRRSASKEWHRWLS
jgi:hypothetical protein